MSHLKPVSITFVPSHTELSSHSDINMSCSEKEISARDLQVLDLLFDQTKTEHLLKNCNETIHDEVDVKDCDEPKTRENEDSKECEVEGVKLAEAANFDEALEKFNKSIELAPNRPSPYNNRAQLFRFQKEDESKL